jgi:hypothetical protein
MLLENVPVFPSVVFVCKAIVGFALVDQHIPLEVINAPPLLVIVPPLVADEAVILLIVAVVNVGTTATGRVGVGAGTGEGEVSLFLLHPNMIKTKKQMQERIFFITINCGAIHYKILF